MERDLLVVRVSPNSFALVASACSATFGLIAGLFDSLTFIRATASADQGASLTSLGVMKELLVNGGIRMAASFVIGLIVGWVLAVIYNAAARSTGGLRLQVRESTKSDDAPGLG